MNEASRQSEFYMENYPDMTELITPDRPRINDLIIRSGAKSLGAPIETCGNEIYPIISAAPPRATNDEGVESCGFTISGIRHGSEVTTAWFEQNRTEAYFVRSGIWRFELKDRNGSAQLKVSEGEVILIPPNTVRRFTNTGKDIGFLWRILAGDERGNEIRLSPSSAPDPVASLRPLPANEPVQNALNDRLIHRVRKRARRPVTSSAGYHYRRLFEDGHTPGSDQINLSELVVVPGDVVSRHRVQMPEVLMISTGRLIVSVDGEKSVLSPGDTLFVPASADREMRNAGDSNVAVLSVRPSTQVQKPKAIL